MRRSIGRHLVQGVFEQGERAGTAPLVSSVGCASSPFTSLRSAYPYAFWVMRRPRSLIRNLAPTALAAPTEGCCVGPGAAASRRSRGASRGGGQPWRRARCTGRFPNALRVAFACTASEVRRLLIFRRNVRGVFEKGARVGTAPLVSSVGCAFSPFTSLRITHPHARGLSESCARHGENQRRRGRRQLPNTPEPSQGLPGHLRHPQAQPGQHQPIA